MKFKLVLIGIIIYSFASGQGISNIWMGGYANWYGMQPYGGFRIEFGTGIPVVTYESRVIDFNFTGTTICDTNGNFLFATNGVIIMNNANDTMQNGSGLNPSAYTNTFVDGLRLVQPNIIIPDPGNSNLYYLFHSTLDTTFIVNYSDKLYYSIIDMNGDNGKGSVILKNMILSNFQFAPCGVVACKHANGRDWWICTHEQFGSTFYFYLLTPSGPSFSHSQSIGFREGYGSYQFSPDGSKLGGYNTDDDFEIFDFDRCSGLLSNYRHIAINDTAVSSGASFSPNSRYLYGSSIRYLYQVDATSNQPDTTLTTVGVWDGTYSGTHAATFYLSALGPDGKIYVTTPSTTTTMHYIEFPDSTGIACNVVQHAIVLPSKNTSTVPNHPNYFLGHLVGSSCDTLVSVVENNELTIKVQPNPSQGQFQIVYPPQPSSGVLNIYNVMGKNIYTEPVAPWSQLKNIDISNAGVGIYFLQIYWEEKAVNIKIVKE